MDSTPIHALDLGYRGLARTIASYLVLGPEGPVLIECGPAATLENLKKRLEEHGLTPDDVRHVVVTHIHLDHAGCLGWWARHGAEVHVHEVGAPHIIDPTRLLNSARRIYGDQLEPLFGEVLPAPAERVHAVKGGETLRIAGLELVAHDTPGHARHHHVWELDGVAFTGDAVGIKLPGLPFLDVPAVPPEFDLEAWLRTLAGLKQCNFRRLYPTHYGAIDDAGTHIDAFTVHVQKVAGFVKDQMDRGADRDEILERYVDWNRERAVSAGLDPSIVETYQSVNPMSMSVDGIARYWTKRAG